MKSVDSSILIDLLRGNREVEEKIAEEDEELSVCFPVKCELFRGTQMARRTEEGQKEVTALLKELTNLETNTNSAKKVVELRNKYQDINTFDLMIAGICISQGTTLMTRDKDFQKIKELNTETL